MWDRRPQAGYEGPGPLAQAPAYAQNCRRAYYRVAGFLPIRLTPIDPSDVAAAIFDLSLPDPLMQPLGTEEEDSPLAERLRRLEEKLDLLLGATSIEVPRQLSGKDRRSLVFSGSGLALDVTWCFRRGDVYKLELLLPPPYSRTLRAVVRSVEDSAAHVEVGSLRRLALALTHMEVDERDALIAYSYDLQRFALRSRVEPGASE